MFRRLITAAAAAVLMVAVAAPAASAHPSCWGQASKVFAQTGELGEHSSSFETPRLGLANLADALGLTFPEELGAFVAAELGLTVEACL